MLKLNHMDLYIFLLFCDLNTSHVKVKHANNNGLGLGTDLFKYILY